MRMMTKMASRKLDNQVLAVFLLACKEMATGIMDL